MARIAMLSPSKQDKAKRGPQKRRICVKYFSLSLLYFDKESVTIISCKDGFSGAWRERETVD